MSLRESDFKGLMRLTINILKAPLNSLTCPQLKMTVLAVNICSFLAFMTNQTFQTCYNFSTFATQKRVFVTVALQHFMSFDLPIFSYRDDSFCSNASQRPCLCYGTLDVFCSLRTEMQPSHPLPSSGCCIIGRNNI